jgi:hypothetical protein
VGVDVSSTVREDRPGANPHHEQRAGVRLDERIVGIDRRIAVEPQAGSFSKSTDSMPTDGFSVMLPVLRNMPLPS